MYPGPPKKTPNPNQQQQKNKTKPNKTPKQQQNQQTKPKTNHKKPKTKKKENCPPNGKQETFHAQFFKCMLSQLLGMQQIVSSSLKKSGPCLFLSFPLPLFSLLTFSYVFPVCLILLFYSFSLCPDIPKCLSTCQCANVQSPSLKF